MSFKPNYYSNNYGDNQRLGYSNVSKNYGGYNQGYSQRSILMTKDRFGSRGRSQPWRDRVHVGKRKEEV